jgi:hypothetical protein
MIFKTRQFAAVAALGTMACLAGAAHADEAAPAGRLTAHLPTTEKKSIQLEVPRLVEVKQANCALPNIPNPTSFPFSIRVGGLLTPTTKLSAGVDLTLPDVHLFSGVATRIDGDVIFGANLHGSQTLIPVTFDQLVTKTLPSGSSLYFGGGVGMYFGGQSRFGGKAVVGTMIKNLGVEADVLWAGTGNPYLMLTGRIGL